MKIFGKAEEYYRARVQKLMEVQGPAIKWDEDILYRRPKAYQGKSRDIFLVQIVKLDDSQAVEIKRFTDLKKAEAYRQKISGLLEELTINEFEAKFSL